MSLQDRLAMFISAIGADVKGLNTTLLGKLDTAAAPELILDTVGSALTPGPGISIVPDDAGNIITISAQDPTLVYSSELTADAVISTMNTSNQLFPQLDMLPLGTGIYEVVMEGFYSTASATTYPIFNLATNGMSYGSASSGGITPYRFYSIESSGPTVGPTGTKDTGSGVSSPSPGPTTGQVIGIPVRFLVKYVINVTDHTGDLRFVAYRGGSNTSFTVYAGSTLKVRKLT